MSVPDTIPDDIFVRPELTELQNALLDKPLAYPGYVISHEKCFYAIATRLAAKQRAYCVQGKFIRRAGNVTQQAADILGSDDFGNAIKSVTPGLPGRYLIVGEKDSGLRALINIEAAQILNDLLLIASNVEGALYMDLNDQNAKNNDFERGLNMWLMRTPSFMRDVYSRVTDTMRVVSEHMDFFRDWNGGGWKSTMPRVPFYDGVWCLTVVGDPELRATDVKWRRNRHPTTGLVEYFRRYRDDDRFTRWSPLSFLTSDESASSDVVEDRSNIKTRMGYVSETLLRMVGDQYPAVMSLYAEGLVARRKNVAGLFFGAPGIGKTTMMAVYKSIVGKGTAWSMGASVREIDAIIGTKQSHPTSNDVFIHTSAVFIGDMGKTRTFGDRLVDIVSSAGGNIAYRRMHSDYDETNLEVWATLFIETNSPAGLTGVPNAEVPDDRRVFGIVCSSIGDAETAADMERIASGLLDNGDEVSDDAKELRTFCREMLLRVGVDTWSPSRIDRQPFVEWLEHEGERQGVYRGGDNSAISASGLRHTALPDDLVAACLLYDHLRTEGYDGLHIAREITRFVRDTTGQDGVMVPTSSEYRNATGTKQTRVFRGWSTVYGDAVHPSRCCKPEKIILD